MFRDDLPQYTAYVSFDGNFQGCGVIYKHQGVLFLITAGHNCFGKDFKRSCSPANLSVLGENKCNYSVEEIVGEMSVIKEIDMVLLKLIPENTQNCHDKYQSPSLKAAHYSDGPYVKRVNISLKDEAWNVYPLMYDAVVPQREWLFSVDIDDKFLYAGNGTYGPNALGGISGSGLYLETDFSKNQRTLVGIVIEVRKNNLINKVRCSCIGNLKRLLPDVSISDVYETGNVADAIDFLLEEISSKHTEDAVIEHIKENRDSSGIQNLIRKTSLVYPVRRLEAEQVRIMRNLLNGKVIFQERVMKQQVVKALYGKAIEAFRGRSQTFIYSKSPADSKQHWDLLNSVLINLLQDGLKDTLSKADIEILGNYTFSDFINNCTIDLEPEYDASK